LPATTPNNTCTSRIRKSSIWWFRGT
jgi:hypothetical protein